MFERENLIKRLAVFGVLAIALAMAGCGDDDADSREVTSSSLSKTQYVKQVDEICAQTDMRISNKVTPIYRDGGFTTKNLNEAMETVLIPESEAQADRISELGAPEGDEEQIETILVALRQDLDRAKALRDKASKPLAALFKQSNKLARSYGLSNCATF